MRLRIAWCKQKSRSVHHGSREGPVQGTWRGPKPAAAAGGLRLVEDGCRGTGHGKWGYMGWLWFCLGWP